MDLVNTRITLDVHSIISQVSISVPKNDTARRISATLTDGGNTLFIPDGCRAVFAGTKADGTELLNDCIVEGNTVIRYDFTEQTASVIGRVDATIKLYDTDGLVLTSARLTLVVYDGPAGNIVPSEDEKNVIDKMIFDEEIRVANENQRILAEDGRKAAELIRDQNENQRILAESLRKTALTLSGNSLIQRNQNLLNGQSSMEIAEAVDGSSTVRFDASKFTVGTNALSGYWVQINGVSGYVGSNTPYSLTLFTDRKATTPLPVTATPGTLIYILGDDVTDDMRGVIGAAPAGFGGYGEITELIKAETNAQLFSTLENELTKIPYGCGKRLTLSSREQPLRDFNYIGVLQHYEDGIAVFKGITYGETTSIGDIEPIECVISKNGNNWIIELVNPPMQVGVEYRTTERCEGKPVYKRKIDLDSMASNGSRSYKVAAEGALSEIVACTILVKNSYGTVTSLSDEPWGSYRFHVNSNRLEITVNATLEGYTGTAILAYTKV